MNKQSIIPHKDNKVSCEQKNNCLLFSSVIPSGELNRITKLSFELIIELSVKLGGLYFHPLPTPAQLNY